MYTCTFRILGGPGYLLSCLSRAGVLWALGATDITESWRRIRPIHTSKLVHVLKAVQEGSKSNKCPSDLGSSEQPDKKPWDSQLLASRLADYQLCIQFQWMSEGAKMRKRCSYRERALIRWRKGPNKTGGRRALPETLPRRPRTTPKEGWPGRTLEGGKRSPPEAHLGMRLHCLMCPNLW